MNINGFAQRLPLLLTGCMLLLLSALGCGGGGGSAPAKLKITIADRVNGRVVELDSIPPTTWTQLSGSAARPELLDELIAVDRDGPWTYILTLQGKIVRFNTITGAGYAAHSISLGFGEGDIRVVNGKMWVSRAATGEVWYFSNWSAMPTAPWITISGAWLGFLSDGPTSRLFVSSSSNQRIYEITTGVPSVIVDGALLAAPANLDQPQGLCYDQLLDRLIICDGANQTLDEHVLSTQTYTNGSPLGYGPIDVNRGPDGKWYITYVTGVGVTLNPLTLAGLQTYGNLGPNQGEFAEPWSIVVFK